VAAYGQDVCRDVLQQTQINDTSLWSQKLAYLWSINTDQQFQDAKNAHGGLTTIISAIPIQAMVDYNSFTQWRKQFSESLQWTASTESSRHLITSFLPPESINAWLVLVGNLQPLDLLQKQSKIMQARNRSATVVV
jgi:hypothetical protein